MPSSRIQSRDPRTVMDLPWAGVAVRLLLQVRRFRRDNKTCPRVIFCERLLPAIAAYARLQSSQVCPGAEGSAQLLRLHHARTAQRGTGTACRYWSDLVHLAGTRTSDERLRARARKPGPRLTVG